MVARYEDSHNDSQYTALRTDYRHEVQIRALIKGVDPLVYAVRVTEVEEEMDYE
jgi:hypothetical protein